MAKFMLLVGSSAFFKYPDYCGHGIWISACNQVERKKEYAYHASQVVKVVDDHIKVLVFVQVIYLKKNLLLLSF